MERICLYPAGLLTIARNCTMRHFFGLRHSLELIWNSYQLPQALSRPQNLLPFGLPLPAGLSNYPQISRGQSPHELQILLKKEKKKPGKYGTRSGSRSLLPVTACKWSGDCGQPLLAILWRTGETKEIPLSTCESAYELYSIACDFCNTELMKNGPKHNSFLWIFHMNVKLPL